jgi:hypothetical protein
MAVTMNKFLIPPKRAFVPAGCLLPTIGFKNCRFAKAQLSEEEELHHSSHISLIR